MATNKELRCEYCDSLFLAPRKKKFCTTECRRKNAARKSHSKRRPRLPREKSLNTFIINKFFKKPGEVWRDPIAVKREMRFTKKLIKKYPLEIFWRSLPTRYREVEGIFTETLAWYVSDQGLAYLQIQYKKFCLDIKPPTRHNISDVKFGDDKIISKKSTSIKDFLNHGGKKENN